MNGIIFHGKSAIIGCSAEFLFEPEVSTELIQAIAEFSTGEKAYAQIIREYTINIIVRVGEYFNDAGTKLTEQSWLLCYNSGLKSWEIVDNLQ